MHALPSMIKVKHIDHVAIAVGDKSSTASDLARLFGLAQTKSEHVADRKTDVVFLQPHGGDAALEMVCSAGNPGLQRFVDQRDTALHHVCLAVDDLVGSLATLKAAGIPLIDETPRPGARGHLTAFIHPKATGGVLFELCQAVPS